MTGQIALVFPGQGSQHVGMGKGLWEAFPRVRPLFEEASDLLGYDLARLCFEGPEERLTLTENAQPALVTVSAAARLLFEEAGGTFQYAAGHSLGEYSALVATRVLRLKDAVRTVHLRGRFMQEAVPPGEGAMAAILGMEDEEVQRLCEAAQTEGVVEVANLNCPGQTVISGERGAVEKALGVAKERGAKRTMMLPVSAPFHCRLMEEAGRRLAAVLSGIVWSPFRVPVVSNVTASLVTDSADVPPLLVGQVSAPVRWTESIRTLCAQGVDTFIEVGPGRVLSGLIRRIAPDARVWHIEDSATLESTVHHLQQQEDGTGKGHRRR